MKRPRFSLRTLAIVVALICVYIAALEATKKFGLPEIPKSGTLNLGDGTTIYNAESPLPLIVSCDESRRLLPSSGHEVWFSRQRHYYLWLFGPEIELPLVPRW